MDLRGTHKSTRVIITEYWLRVGLSVISDAAINSLLVGCQCEPHHPTRNSQQRHQVREIDVEARSGAGQEEQLDH